MLQKGEKMRNERIKKYILGSDRTNGYGKNKTNSEATEQNLK